MKTVKYPGGHVEELRNDIPLTNIRVPRIVDNRGGAVRTNPDDVIVHSWDRDALLEIHTDEYAPVLVGPDSYEYRKV